LEKGRPIIKNKRKGTKGEYSFGKETGEAIFRRIAIRAAIRPRGTPGWFGCQGLDRREGLKKWGRGGGRARLSGEKEQGVSENA